MFTQPIARIADYIRTYDASRLSYLDFHRYLNAIRLFVLVAFSVRYQVYHSTLEPTENLYKYKWWILLAIGACYLLMIVISQIILLTNPLFALKSEFHESQAYFEIIALILAIGFTVHAGTHLTLFFFIPFMALLRVKSRSLKYIVFQLLLTLLATNIVLQVIAQHRQWAATPSSLVDFTIMLLILYIISRSWRNGRTKLCEANFNYALGWIQRKYSAELTFLRIYVPEKEQESLVLVASSPESIIDHRHAYNFTRMKIEGHSSIATRSVLERTYQTITGQRNLLDRLNFKGLVEAYRLESGLALPILSMSQAEHPHGTMSLYWSKPEGYAEHVQSLQKDLQYLQQYIEQQDGADIELAEEIATVHIHQAESARLNRWLEKIQKNVDLWETANLIAVAASDLSSYETAFIMFWDEDSRIYRLQEPYGFYSEAEYIGHSELTIDKILHNNGYPYNLLEVDTEWGVSTGFTKCLSFPLHSADKTLGLLIIGTAKEQRLSLGTQELILTLARHSAVDLRNCQLLNKANTKADMAHALSSMIHDLFVPSEISEDDKDLYSGIAEIICEAVRAHSCSFGLLNAENQRLDSKTFSTTETVPGKRVNINSPETLSLIQETLLTKIGIYRRDYSSSTSGERNQFVDLFNIKRTYAVAVKLDATHLGIIFINYDQLIPQTEYQIKQVLPMAQEHIPKAWKAWQAWHKAQTHQKQIWKYDIHDQLNEVQFNITLPLERLKHTVTRNGDSPHVEDIRKIHRSARSVWTTLKHIMDDMRHPVILDEGLLPAIQYLTRRDARLQVDVECVTGEPPSAVANPIYRLAREAIHNGFKHGGSKVHIAVQSHSKSFKMTIADNGPGMDTKFQAGSGMTLMQYQATLIDATLQWLPGDSGCGTVVEVVWQEKV